MDDLKQDVTKTEEKAEGNSVFKRVIKIVGSVLFYAVLGFLLAFLISGVVSRFQGKDTVDFLGYSFYVVVTPSMETVNEANTEFLAGREDERIKRGDLVITRKLEKDEDIGLYDVVTYFDNSKKVTVIHRIYDIEKTQNGALYTTRGDGNNADDPQKRTVDSFTGKHVVTLKGVGKVVSFLKSPYIYMAIGGCGFVVFTLLLVFELTKKKDKSQ